MIPPIQCPEQGICVRPVARASRPWGVYKLSHGRDGHATQVYLFYVAESEGAIAGEIVKC